MNSLSSPFYASSFFNTSLPSYYTEERPLYLDNTILSSVATCSTQALLSYHNHLQSLDPSPNLLAGTATHEALAHFLGTGDQQAAMALFRSAYYPFSSQSLPAESPLSWENTSTTLDYWFDTHTPGTSTFPLPVTSSLESTLRYPLWEEVWGKRVMFVGLVDGIVQDPSTGLLSLMDHKTTGFSLNKNYSDQFILSSQLSGYLWLAQQNNVHLTLGAPQPISTILINAIKFSNLPSSKRRCPLHSLPYLECRAFHAESALLGPYSRTPTQLQTWHHNAIALAMRWMELREEFPGLSTFPDMPKEGQFHYNICPKCPFNSPCRGLITPSSIPLAFGTRQWTPWEGKMVGED